MEIVYPFIDYDFYEFCMKVPAHLLVDHKVYMKLFTKTYPEYASVAYSKSLLPLSFPPKMHKIAEKANHMIFDRILRKYQQLLKKDRPPICWVWDNWDGWLKHETFQQEINKIIEQSPVIDHSRTAKLLQAHRSYKISIPYGLPMLSLLGFALWGKILGWSVEPKNGK
jgi:hypothetical protein